MSKDKLIRLPENESESMALFKATYGKDLTDLEMALFFTHSKSVGLDPLRKQIYAIKRNTKRGPVVTHQTSIDGFRAIAARSGSHAGTDEIEFKYVKDRLDEAKCTVWKIIQGQRVSFVGKAKWNEFFPGDAMGSMWKKLPETMLGKCAESAALRRAFPEDLGQLYVDEEMHQSLIKDVVPKSEAVKALEDRIDEKPTPEFVNYGETEELINE